MRIKRLEIQGFKSFKDKTIIHFDRPITGIVGPNGSGKSNIVDAFFWVMGEQSYKHIRSSGSDDIIFKGSSKYQPLGLAEATLVLETEEVDLEGGPLAATTEDKVKTKKKEISVTRRVYRSGEGEYFVNGLPARLKDIQELFLDTGVGAKGYSVIEQGQIDKVVNSKPEDRRLLIEDAAGIAKYKARKKESLKKLESANANLQRLNDVLQEIERSLGSLERQAQKARKYKEYRTELLEKETTWGRRKYRLLTEKLTKVQNDRDGLEHLLTGMRAELSETEMRLETDRIQQMTDSRHQEDLQAEVEHLAGELQHHQSALELSRKRQEDLRRQLAQLESEKNQIDDELIQYRESVSVKSIDFDGIDGRLLEFQSQVDALKNEVVTLRNSHDQNLKEAESKRRQFVEKTQNLASSEAQIATLNERIQSNEHQMEALRSQVVDAETRIQDLEEAKEVEASRRDHALAEKQELQVKVEDLKQKAKVIESQVKELRAEREKSLRQLTHVASKLKSLEDLEKAREGMAEGPKNALAWADQNHIRFGVLSDFIEVEKGYESAVESVLGHAFERLFSEDSEQAFQALHFLREGNLGSASIQIRFPKISNGTDAVANPLGQYFKAVTPEGVSAQHASEIHSWLKAHVASVEVLEEVPTQGDVSSYEKEGISFVTKNGIYFDAQSGVLFGGSQVSEQATTLLNRKRAIQEMKIELEGLESSHQEIESKLEAALTEEEDDRQTLAELTEHLNEVQLQASRYDQELRALTARLEDLKRSNEKVFQQVESLKQQRHSAEESLTKVQASIEGFLSERAELEAWIAAHEQSISDRDQNLRQKENELQNLQIQFASENERRNSLKRELEAEQRYLVDRERRASEIERLLETLVNDQGELTGGDQDHEEKRDELMRVLSEKRTILSELKDRLEGSNRGVQESLEKIKSLHRLNDEKSRELNQMAIEIERVLSDVSHLKANMEEKYGEGCLESAPAPATEQTEMTDPIVTAEMSEEDERRLSEEVESLRERIRRLGEVNTMAVEEFDEMQKRHDHLFKEKQDLVTSMDHLQQAIDHINKTSEERFQKAFEAIATRFEKLFPIIFGGGMAKLSLVYPEGSTDILDAGVDILAQPPGKKISNMTLLSGGEKALTAISMIFAIFMVKPSPFCILDEVDAPLDDSNIGKFNALVREMSAKSQFILVTHNKKTMELNDALYGVTMEEPGVSRMVSIQLQ